MRRIYWIIALIMISITLKAAWAAEGNITIDAWKIYMDGDRIDYDHEEDDRVVVNPGKDIELQIKFYNDYESSYDVDVNGVFDLDEELERDKEIEIDEKDTKTVVLEYYIPSDIDKGTYQFELEWRYRVNGTDYKHTEELDFRVREPEINTNEILQNLTQQILNEKNENNELLQSVINLSGVIEGLAQCEAELSDIKAKKEVYEQNKEDYEECKNDLERKRSESDNCTEERSSLKARVETMYTQQQLNNEVSKAKKEQSDSTNRTWFMLALVVVAFVVIQNKKKSTGDEGKTESLTEQEWG